MTKSSAPFLPMALATMLGLGALQAADIQSNFWYPSTISTDANGPLDLLAELNYDDAQANAPIVVVMHGYSNGNGVANVRGPAQRLRDSGFFAISVAMRGRDGSDGVRDSGGLEVHDIYDAVEAVKANPTFVGLIDPSNVHITGYSGGGGNTMSALSKFPDYFRVGASFFGMSDYGYNLTDGWYN
ncbi:alpha/beta hydrolase family protein, partial [Haloferula sp.]|uniref:alpha/beta hydrolase family protein n=1 Tax=Haloferula sp. TaxID=2497595 RepID=UPI003C71F47F